MRASECLIQLGSPLGFPDVLDQRQDRADMLQVLRMLALKDSGEFFANTGQSRYPCVAATSSLPRSPRIAADFSVWRVLMAACSPARLKSFMACITFSKPICCWFVPAAIC